MDLGGLAKRDAMRHATQGHGESSLITLGEVSQRVTDLQKFLGATLGPWNYESVALLIEYQQFEGLVADGIPGPKTLAAIAETKAKEGIE